MELLLLVFFCLLTGSEVTFGAENGTTVTVDEGRDVILPCSLREDITKKKFEWMKGGRQVFLYDDGDHSNFVPTGQDQQFKGRVSHFPDKLKSGNASITISNMKVTDSGLYTCEFPDLQPRQTFQMKLIVYVEAPQPSVRILLQRGKSAELQCEVRGAFPKPELHWEDRAGKKLPAEEPQESERGGLFYIILQTTVIKTDNYRCVVTQEEINHQAHDETYVSVPVLTGGETAAIVIGVIALVVAVVLVVYRWRVRIMSVFMKGAAKPYVKTLQQTDFNAVLQCEVRRGFPKPELYWEDGAGNKLPAEKTQESERGGLYYIILKTTVYKTGIYRCVVKQKEINHQTDAYIYVHITGTTFITVKEGSDVILPCSLSSRQDITNKKFEWKKDGLQVFLYDDEDHSNNVSTSQDQLFKGRVSHFLDELKSGNASIIIRSTKVADSGDYTCEFTDQLSQIFYMKLVVVVGTTVITVKEGNYITLPCSLSSMQDITQEKFEWKKDGRQVFLYDDRDRSSNVNTHQDQQFKGRVSYFRGELKSGNASISISNIKVFDSGYYTCEFPDLQPRQMFHILLVVHPNASTAPNTPVVMMNQPKIQRKQTDVLLMEPVHHS